MRAVRLLLVLLPRSAVLETKTHLLVEPAYHKQRYQEVGLFEEIKEITVVDPGRSWADSVSKGIERLKKENPTWEKTSSWDGMKQAFGGGFSPAWFSPFSGTLYHQVPQDIETGKGEIVTGRLEGHVEVIEIRGGIGQCTNS